MAVEVKVTVSDGVGVAVAVAVAGAVHTQVGKWSRVAATSHTVQGGRIG